ncbi:MAG: hypothetical protein V1913_05175 [Fibrobacterota bacterium]
MLNLFYILLLSAACSVFPQEKGVKTAADTASASEKERARRDLNILLGLPDEPSHAKDSAGGAGSTDAASNDMSIHSPLYQKGMMLYKMGLKDYMNGNYDRAASIFKQVLDIDPLQRNAYDYLMRSSQSSDEQKNPDKKILAAQAQADSRNELLFQAGLEKFTKGNYPEAKKIWRKIIEASPDFTKAFDYIREADTKLDAIVDNFLSQGQYYYQKGEVATAIAEWGKGLKTCPGNERLTTQIDAARTQQKSLVGEILTAADAQLKEKNFEAAFKTLSEGSARVPDSKELKDKTGDTKRKLEEGLTSRLNEAKTLYENKKYVEALAAFESILSAVPDHLLAREYARKASEQQAIEEKRQGLRDLFNEAVNALDKGRSFEALDLLRQIEKEDPGYPELQARITTASEGQQKTERRKELASQFNRGVDYYSKGYYQAALKEWQACLKGEPDNAMVRQYIQEAEKRMQESPARQKELAQKEKEAFRLNKEAVELYKKKAYAEAYKGIEKAVEYDPQNSALRKTLKTCRRELLKEKERLTPADNQKADDLFQQGIDLYRSGQYKKAIETWKQVIQMKPDHKKAATYIENVTQKLKKIESI